MPKTPKIIAPAGSPESFAAALNAGADAVYVGAGGFNMRAGANALSMDTIAGMAERAKDSGVEFLLAMNTIAYDGEFDEASRVLDHAAEISVDAVIMWDTGLMALARERGLTVNLSTQASVSNVHAALFYESLGVKRIVLARELSLEQIAATIAAARAKGSSLEFECFVHGAMCVAVSGRCLTSQFISGRSANRGDCLQPCRHKFRVTEELEGYELDFEGHSVMSARDLCSIDIVDRLVEAGIDAFKIEGRMRDAFYVKTTVEAYREARDAALAGSFTSELGAGLRERLKRVFHREFSSGFYLSRPDHEMTEKNGNQSEVVKEYAGKVTNYFAKVNAAEIKLEARGISTGDNLLVTGPTTGAMEFSADSIHSESGDPLTEAAQGSIIGLQVPEKVRRSDSLFVLRNRQDKPQTER